MRQQVIVFAVLLISLIFFVNGRFRYDLVALMALLAVTLTGIISPEASFSGFAHPAVITVAAILVISKGLMNAGVVDFITRWLGRFNDKPTTQVAVLTGIVAVLSTFMNNVGALAILLPVAIRMGRKNKIPPSVLLMPLAFGSLLGGLATLIGTPPNIIIATYRAQNGVGPFSMFDFAPVGIGVAIAGIIFIALVGWRLIPHRKGQTPKNELFSLEDYLTEICVTRDSKIVGKSLRELGKITDADINIVGLVRERTKITAPSSFEVIHEWDILIIKADSVELKKLLDSAGLSLVGAKDHHVDREALGSEQISLIEAVVREDSPLIRRTARDLHLRWRFGVNLLAVSRQGDELKERLNRIHFLPGDIVLLQVQADSLQETMNNLGCLPLAERGLQIGIPRRTFLVLGIFVTAIIFTTLGILPVQISLTAAAVGIVLSGSLTLKEAYESIHWSVIVLLGAMIPVGEALEISGGAQLIANSILGFSNHLPASLILGILLVITLLLTNVINNAAAAVLMAPIAFNIAQGLAASPDPFLMAVTIGASCAFLTPIGHQSNTLVMGPGGYHFQDYWRMGLPLTIITIFVSIPLILFYWPLY